MSTAEGDLTSSRQSSIRVVDSGAPRTRHRPRRSRDRDPGPPAFVTDKPRSHAYTRDLHVPCLALGVPVDGLAFVALARRDSIHGGVVTDHGGLPPSREPGILDRALEVAPGGDGTSSNPDNRGPDNITRGKGAASSREFFLDKPCGGEYAVQAPYSADHALVTRVGR